MPHYDVAFDSPASHHVTVRLHVAAAPSPLVVWMPTWIPGSYMIREFARNLRRIEARGRDGATRAVRRIDKTTFEIDAGAGEDVIVEYRVYAFERSVRTSFVDDEDALLNGPSIFLAVEGRTDEECSVEVALPEGWEIEAPLPRGARGFVAADYEHLVDSPIQCGFLAKIDVGEPPAHRFVLVPGRSDFGPPAARLRRDVPPILEAARAVFGGEMPYERYVFFVHLVKEGRGGLEHRASCVLTMPRQKLVEDDAWYDFLSLVAHEHFHVWNVKRTRPRELVHPDLRREVYSRALWICEGVTAYYDELLPARAGVIPAAAFRRRLAAVVDRYRAAPGRHEQDLEEASLTAWTRLYRPDEDSPNSTMSYYLKGSLVALLLDLEIRDTTDGVRSLDDVMRALHERFGPESDGYAVEDFERLAAEAAGRDLAPFFAAAVRGTDELDLEAAFARAGMTLRRERRTPRPTAADWIGVRTRTKGGRLEVETVEAGSAAARAGLAARDEILAVFGERANGGAFDALISMYAEGKELCPITIFRDDRMHVLKVTPPPEPRSVHVLADDPAAGERKRALRAGWLGAAAEAPP